MFENNKTASKILDILLSSSLDTYFFVNNISLKSENLIIICDTHNTNYIHTHTHTHNTNYTHTHIPIS